MFKRLSLILILIIVSGCGYTPLYLGSKNLDLKINLINNVGDREISNALRIYLRKNIASEAEEEVKLNINSKFSKTITSRDAGGLPSNYDLDAATVIIIEYNDKTQTFNVTQKYTMEKLNSTFDEKNYISTIKRNFANTVYQKLIMKLNQIKLDD